MLKTPTGFRHIKKLGKRKLTTAITAHTQENQNGFFQQLSNHWPSALIGSIFFLGGLSTPIWWLDGLLLISPYQATATLCSCSIILALYHLRSSNDSIAGERIKLEALEAEFIAERAHRQYADASTHEITHLMRDLISDHSRHVQKYLRQGNPPPVAIEHTLFKKDNGIICTEIANRFQKLLRDDDISCALRIAYPVDAHRFKLYTSAWSGNRLESRIHTSQPLYSNRGIPEFLKSENYEGVLHVDDIEKATAAGICVPNYNLEKFDDVAQIVAVPVCLRERNENIPPILIAVLYLTTPNHSEMDLDSHADMLHTVADSLSMYLLGRYQNLRFAATHSGHFEDLGSYSQSYINLIQHYLLDFELRPLPPGVVDKWPMPPDRMAEIKKKNAALEDSSDHSKNIYLLTDE